MTILIGGGGGIGPVGPIGPDIPGLSGDGLTPGGIIVLGAVAAGAAYGSGQRSFMVDVNGFVTQHSGDSSAFAGTQLDGMMLIRDTAALAADQDDLLSVTQITGLAGNNAGSVISAYRTGALNGHAYTFPTVLIEDDTASTQPALQVNKSSATQLQVDGDGVRVHGKFKSGAVETAGVGASTGKRLAVYDEAGTLQGYIDLRVTA